MARLPIRLLVIDDDPDLAVQIRLLLRSSRTTYEVLLHDDSAQPLNERLKSGGIDVCLLDHFLADRNGADVLRALPHSADLPPVVVLTGASDPALADTYLELGAADFLSKDEINPVLLDRSIRYAIQHWTARRDIIRTHQALLHSERLAAVGRLATGIAHEYNNLNAVILCDIELLLGTVKDERAKERLERIITTLERSRRISQSLLKLSRTSAGDAPVIDLRQGLLDCLTLLESQVVGGSAKLITGLPDQPVLVRMHVNDLHQVLVNLAANAMHALWKADQPCISIKLHTEGQGAVFSVADNGIGIANEDLPRIFEPFFSRKGAHDRAQLYPARIEGLGLGLAVCSSLLEQSGGSIAVTSTPGVGTLVTVRLPIAATRLQSNAPAEPKAISASTTAEVAVVDDNQVLLDLVHEGLTSQGFNVTVFSDPAVFLEQGASQHWGTLVLDWQMPHFTGADVLMRLGSTERSPPLPVILLSGTDPDLPDPMPAGLLISKILTKPFRMNTLAEALNTALKPPAGHLAGKPVTKNSESE
jgi:two-component system, cell cycle sensor histidine kinase and response regulator CckA